MIFTQQERASLPWPPPQTWMAGWGSIEACGEVKAWGSVDKWVEMAQMVALIMMMMMNLHLGKRQGGILCPAVSLKHFERRTNTSPSITANDKTGWVARRRKLTHTDRRPAPAGPYSFSLCLGDVFKARGQCTPMCTQPPKHTHTHTHTHSCFKIQLWGIEELEWLNWFSKWPLFRDE